MLYQYVSKDTFYAWSGHMLVRWFCHRVQNKSGKSGRYDDTTCFSLSFCIWSDDCSFFICLWTDDFWWKSYFGWWKSHVISRNFADVADTSALSHQNVFRAFLFHLNQGTKMTIVSISHTIIPWIPLFFKHRKFFGKKTMAFCVALWMIHGIKHIKQAIKMNKHYTYTA